MKPLHDPKQRLIPRYPPSFLLFLRNNPTRLEFVKTHGDEKKPTKVSNLHELIEGEGVLIAAAVHGQQPEHRRIGFRRAVQHADHRVQLRHGDFASLVHVENIKQQLGAQRDRNKRGAGAEPDARAGWQGWEHSSQEATGVQCAASLLMGRC